MFQLRTILTAHFSSWYGAMDILDEVWMPRWLDHRLHRTKNRDQRHFQRAERAGEKPPVGKDASQDW
jgi:hypothetical protein